MTPERRRGLAYALIGAAIACLYQTYQYAKPWVPGTEPAPDFAPYLFGGIALVCALAGIVLLLLMRNEKTPAVRLDPSTPAGKKARLWAFVGLGALALSLLIDFAGPSDDLLWTGISLLLIAAMFVCFVICNRIVRASKGKT